MAECIMKQTGDRIDWTPETALVGGQVVVLGTGVGVATEPIAAGVLGSLQTTGIGEFLKYSGEAIDFDDVVYWDEGTNTASKTSAYGEACIGKCVQQAGAGASDETVRVRLIPGLGDALA